MEERILEIVFYLVQHARTHDGRVAPFKTIARDLKSLGFTDSEISSAYGWLLDELAKDGGKINPVPDGGEAVRVFSEMELQYFTPEAAGFLLHLKQFNLLSASQFERILERAMLLGSGMIDLPVIKVIAARYIFNSGTAVDLNWFNIDGTEAVN